MKKIHRREQEQFKKLFSQEGLEDFDDRLAVLEAFLQTENHITVTDLVEIMAEQGVDLDPAFVRDTLKLLCHFGFASKNRFQDGKVRYEHRHLGCHHDHMICTKCGTIIEFEDEQLESLQTEVAAALGFYMLQHRLELYGLCSECRHQRGLTIPLVRAKPGEQLVIESLSGGSQARLRLTAMGLKVGDLIEVVTSAPRGEVVIAVDEKRYALGRGLANKIQVTPCGQMHVSRNSG
jgi:Fur family transcriptional regulator, ferric uptake regulator